MEHYGLAQNRSHLAGKVVLLLYSLSIGLINAEQIAGDKVSNAQSKLWTMNCTKRGERSLFTSGARTLGLARGTEANDSSTSSAP